MPTDEAAAADRGPSSRPEPHSETAPFPYMRWAKAYLGCERLSLGMSGLSPVTPAERAQIGMAPPPEVGDPADLLKTALAERYGVEPGNVQLAAGTSHGNFLAYLAFARGGHVAVETPAYEALHGLAGAVGASLSTFERDPERGWQIDRGSLERAVGPHTGLIVVSDLHNPSGMRLTTGDLDALIAHAHACDAAVLVDEVYADFDPEERPTAARRDARVLVTNSLTKTHGLGDLRAGWVLGSAEHVRALDEWNDLVHPVLPPAPLLEAARFLPHAAERLRSVRVHAAARAAQVDAWIQATPHVSWVRPDAGITGFLCLGEPEEAVDGDAVAAQLYARHGVRAVPGSFFQRPGWLRLSFMLESADLAEALEGLGAILETLP